MKNSELEWGSYNFFGAASTTTPARSFQKKANCVEMFIFITSCHELSNDQRCFFCITRSLLRLVAFTHNGGSSFQLSQAPHSDRTATAGWKPNKHTALFDKKKRPTKRIKKYKNTSKHSPCVRNNPPQIPLAGFLTINYPNYIHTSHFGGWAFFGDPAQVKGSWTLCFEWPVTLRLLTTIIGYAFLVEKNRKRTGGIHNSCCGRWCSFSLLGRLFPSNMFHAGFSWACM